VAGCSALSSHEGDGEIESATVTLQVRPDEEDLQALQEEIGSQVEAGEIDRMQAQALFRQRQAELTRTAVDGLRNRTTNNESLAVSVDDSVSQVGAVLVTGEPAALIETLSFEEVAGMFPAETFERAQQAGAGGGAGGADGSTPAPTPSE
jgi:hypothetical protein